MTAEVEFQKQVLDRLSHLEEGIATVKSELDLIKEHVVDDTLLTDEDKKDIDAALQEEKEGKLLTKEKVFL